MGTILDQIKTEKQKKIFGDRLRAVPCFSSHPLRLPDGADAFERLTGGEWRSIASVCFYFVAKHTTVIARPSFIFIFNLGHAGIACRYV